MYLVDVGTFHNFVSGWCGAHLAAFKDQLFPLWQKQSLHLDSRTQELWKLVASSGSCSPLVLRVTRPLCGVHWLAVKVMERRASGLEVSGLICSHLGKMCFSPSALSFSLCLHWRSSRLLMSCQQGWTCWSFARIVGSPLEPRAESKSKTLILTISLFSAPSSTVQKYGGQKILDNGGWN